MPLPFLDTPASLLSTTDLGTGWVSELCVSVQFAVWTLHLQKSLPHSFRKPAGWASVVLSEVPSPSPPRPPPLPCGCLSDSTADRVALSSPPLHPLPGLVVCHSCFLLDANKTGLGSKQHMYLCTWLGGTGAKLKGVGKCALVFLKCWRNLFCVVMTEYSGWVHSEARRPAAL